MDEQLPIMGRERALVNAFAKKLLAVGQREGDYTALRETPRGTTFEVHLAEGRPPKPTGRVVRVTVEFDRVIQAGDYAREA